MKMTRYLALLRGINVGGKGIIKMTGLKAAFEQMNFTDVKTYIQSGNVVFDSAEKNKAAMIKKIESGLLKEFNIETKTALLTAFETTELVDKKPDVFGEDGECYKYDVIFTIGPITAQNVIDEFKIKEGVDVLYKGKGLVYISRLKKEITKSRFSRIVQTPVYPYITIRNWNTVKKLYEMMK